MSKAWEGEVVPTPRLPKISPWPLTERAWGGLVVPTPRLPETYNMLLWGRTVVGREPNATLPLTSNLFKGLVVPIPVLAVVPKIVPLSKKRLDVREFEPLNL